MLEAVRVPLALMALITRHDMGPGRSVLGRRPVAMQAATCNSAIGVQSLF